MLRNVIIVSPYFPPSNLAGVHRARHLAKHLPSFGWHPIIVCVHERFYQGPIDPDLAALVPSDVEVVRVSAPSARLVTKVGISDLGLTSWFQLRKAVYRLARTREIAAVLITGSPYYPMLLAGGI